MSLQPYKILLHLFVDDKENHVKSVCPEPSRMQRISKRNAICLSFDSLNHKLSCLRTKICDTDNYFDD